MALKRGFQTDMNVKDGRGNTGPRTFWVKAGTETTVVLLDDDPVVAVRHQLFIKGDKQAAGMRQTCAGMDPDVNSEPCPRECLVCNASIRHQQIGRRALAYLTLIDERQFQYKGRNYQDMKLLLELDKKGFDLFRKRKETYGSLKGFRFKVYRSSEQNSPRYGDDWQPLGAINLVQHFWPSPAVPRLIESEQRRGLTLQHQQAVEKLVTPIDYDVEIGRYDPSAAERFVAYLEGDRMMSEARQAAPPAPQGGGGYQPPAPPAAPDYAVPTGQVPQYAAPAHAPAAPQAPAAAAPPAPVAPPAPMPDPAGATAPAGQYQPPPMPAQPGVPAQPAQGQAPVPNAQPPAAVEQGWSPNPPYPQPQPDATTM